MPNNSDNRKRVFAEVVTVEAWHEAFGPTISKADLHADVVFGTARVGGEVESPVRFRLRMKRADVVIVIPDTEPVSVDRRTVSRDAPQLKTHISKTLEASKAAGARAQIDIGASSSGMIGTAKASVAAEAKAASTRKVEVTGELGPMTITQAKTSDGSYRWSIEPTGDEYLEGRPWDAIKSPRMQLIDQRKDRSKGIPPTVRVEVRCKREDIEILDPVIKDEGLWQKVTGRRGFTNRIKAAEAYIRRQLVNEGLEVLNIDDVFGQLTFASTTAESSTKP